jgi:hypothetical protein
LKAEDISAGLAVEVARGKAKIHTLETEVSRQSGEMDKLRSNVKGEPSGPVSFFFLDPRCPFDAVGVMAWASLEHKLAEEVVKSLDLGAPSRRSTTSMKPCVPPSAWSTTSSR